VVRHLGSGASAEVYEAAQLSVDRRVALKLFRGSGPADVDAASMEANNLSKVHSPHTVVLYDRDTTDDGRPVLVMELVDGPTLEAVLATSAPLPARDALILLTQLTVAVAAAHRRGVVHGDIKSGNVVLVDSPRGVSLKILDFGISSLLSDPKGPCSGTWSYMAPEQIEGAPATPSMDVFAMGVVLYDMLGASPRFENAMDALDERKRRVRLRLPPPLRGGPLDQLLGWMTDAEPEARCQDAAQLLAVLDGLDVRSPAIWVGPPLPSSSAAAGPVKIASSRRSSSDSSSSLRSVRQAPTLPVPEGRGAERQGLLASLVAARDGGQPAVLLLGGERGLGKRSLLRWLVETAKAAGGHERTAYVDVSADWARQVLVAIANIDSDNARELSDAVRDRCAPVTAQESTAVLAAFGYLLGVKPDPEAVASLVWKAGENSLVLGLGGLGAQQGAISFLTALSKRLDAQPRPVLVAASVDRWRLAARSGLAHTVAELSRLPCVQIRLVGPLDAGEVLQLGRRAFQKQGRVFDRVDFRLTSLLVEVGCGNPSAVADLCEDLHARDRLLTDDGTLFAKPALSPTPPAPPRVSQRLRRRLLDRVSDLGGAPEPILVLARRCAILGLSFDSELLHDLLEAEARSGHRCAQEIVDSLDARLAQLVELDVLTSAAYGDWQFSQPLLWRALDGFSDRLADGRRVHEIAAAVKSDLFAARGEPRWRLREVELHTARAAVEPVNGGVAGWSGHLDCW
jgi:hypothetical protein